MTTIDTTQVDPLGILETDQARALLRIRDLAHAALELLPTVARLGPTERSGFHADAAQTLSASLTAIDRDARNAELHLRSQARVVRAELDARPPLVLDPEDPF